MSVRRSVVLVTAFACALTGCKSQDSENRSHATQSYGDITVTQCAQDRLDNTSIDVAGTVTSHYSVPYDYSFVVESYNGSTPAGLTSVTVNTVAPDVTRSWSDQLVIAGATTGTFSCHLRSISRTPSQPSLNRGSNRNGSATNP